MKTNFKEIKKMWLRSSLLRELASRSSAEGPCLSKVRVKYWRTFSLDVEQDRAKDKRIFV